MLFRSRILLFGRICAIPAVPSNATQVPVRMQGGRALDSYTQDYRAGQRLIEAEVTPSFEARQRAFLLLKIHGQSLCKRATPNCGACPIASTCAFLNSAAGKKKQTSRAMRTTNVNRKRPGKRP